MKKLLLSALVLVLSMSGCSTTNTTIETSPPSSPIATPSDSSQSQSTEKTEAAADSQEPEPEPVFDPIQAAETLFNKLDGTAGFSWYWPSEDPYEGAPVLIALPEGALSDIRQGCIVTGFDPSEYDYSKRLEELESAGKDLPGQAVWMGASEGLMIELRATSPDAECWRLTKEKLGWAPELEPTFVFPNSSGSTTQNDSVETVVVPNVVGVTEQEAETWLSRNGFKFNVSSNYGFNPKLSLCLSGKGLVTGQSPRAGTEAKNQFSTTLRLEVDCEWR